MKNRIERKRWTLVEKNTGFAPRDLLLVFRYVEFSRVNAQTNGGILIDGLNKLLKISRKLSFNPVQEFNRQYFRSLCDGFLSFLLIFAGKINGLSKKNNKGGRSFIVIVRLQL